MVYQNAVMSTLHTKGNMPLKVYVYQFRTLQEEKKVYP